MSYLPDETEPDEIEEDVIPDEILGESSESMNDGNENIELIIREWLDPKHIKRKTRLNSRQVRAVSILQSLADTYKIKTLDRYLIEFRTNMLSKDGLSSKELENILKARMPEIEPTGLEKLSKFLE